MEKTEGKPKFGDVEESFIDANSTCTGYVPGTVALRGATLLEHFPDLFISETGSLLVGRLTVEAVRCIMTAKSTRRGHEILFVDGIWSYADDSTPANYDRACVRCGQYPTALGYDVCLGEVKNVHSACCGHGIYSPYSMPDQPLNSLNSGDKKPPQIS